MRRTLILCSVILLGLLVGLGLLAGCQSQPEYTDTQTVRELDPTTKIPPTHAVSNTLDQTDKDGDLTQAPLADTVWEMLGQVNRDSVHTDLRRLTGEEPICIDTRCHTITNRATGSDGLQWAMDYLYQELIGLGYAVEVQDWFHSGYTGQNIIVRKPGKVFPNQEIYFVAHLDGMDRSSAADDNASGVTDLMALARVLVGRQFSRTVVLLFTTGEEQGALGARSYVDQLSLEELSTISLVIDVDMVGYDSDDDGAMELWSGDHPPSLVLAQTLSELIAAYQLDLTPSVVTGCT